VGARWTQTLILADNELSEVSEQIGCLKNLRVLDLGHNHLTSVPDALGDLDGLTDFLYLHDNQLTSLPSSLAQLKKITLPEYQRERFCDTARSGLWIGKSDRAAGIRQSIDQIAGLYWAPAAIEGIAP